VPADSRCLRAPPTDFDASACASPPGTRLTSVPADSRCLRAPPTDFDASACASPPGTRLTSVPADSRCLRAPPTDFDASACASPRHSTHLGACCFRCLPAPSSALDSPQCLLTLSHLVRSTSALLRGSVSEDVVACWSVALGFLGGP
jgi:hypothetical protein